MDTRKLHDLGTWRIFSQFNLAMRIKWSKARSRDNTRCGKSYWFRIGDFFYTPSYNSLCSVCSSYLDKLVEYCSNRTYKECEIFSISGLPQFDVFYLIITQYNS